MNDYVNLEKPQYMHEAVDTQKIPKRHRAYLHAQTYHPTNNYLLIVYKSPQKILVMFTLLLKMVQTKKKKKQLKNLINSLVFNWTVINEKLLLIFIVCTKKVGHQNSKK